MIPTSTLLGIMRDREKYKWLFFSGKMSGQQRQQRKCQKESVDTARLEWFSVARAANVPITGNILMEKASEIARKLGHANWKCTKVGCIALNEDTISCAKRCPVKEKLSMKASPTHG